MMPRSGGHDGSEYSLSSRMPLARGDKLIVIAVSSLPPNPTLELHNLNKETAMIQVRFLGVGGRGEMGGWGVGHLCCGRLKGVGGEGRGVMPFTPA